MPCEHCCETYNSLSLDYKILSMLDKTYILYQKKYNISGKSQFYQIELWCGWAKFSRSFALSAGKICTQQTCHIYVNTETKILKVERNFCNLLFVSCKYCSMFVNASSVHHTPCTNLPRLPVRNTTVHEYTIK